MVILLVLLIVLIGTLCSADDDDRKRSSVSANVMAPKAKVTHFRSRVKYTFAPWHHREAITLTPPSDTTLSGLLQHRRVALEQWRRESDRVRKSLSNPVPPRQ